MKLDGHCPGCGGGAGNQDRRPAPGGGTGRRFAEAAEKAERL